MIFAYRRNDIDGLAYYMVTQLLEQGNTAAELMQSVLDTGDEKAINAYIKALYRLLELEPQASQYQHNPTISPYEHNLAVYIVGNLAFHQWLPGDLLDDAGDLIARIADWIADVLPRYGWHGCLKEALHFAGIGTPRGWKSVDLAEEGGAE